jgi:hypothetical protein
MPRCRQTATSTLDSYIPPVKLFDEIRDCRDSGTEVSSFGTQSFQARAFLLPVVFRADLRDPLFAGVERLTGLDFALFCLNGFLLPGLADLSDDGFWTALSERRCFTESIHHLLQRRNIYV